MRLGEQSGRLESNPRLARVRRLYIGIQTLTWNLMIDERGQDLVEYAVVATLISLGAVVAMKGVAVAISTAYVNLSTKVGTYTS